MRTPLAAGLPRQADADRGAPRVDPLQLSGDAPGERAALVPGGQRRLHGDVDGRRLSAAPRAATTRWSSGPWCATTPISTRRSAWRPKAPSRLPGRGQRLPLRHALLELPGPYPLAAEGDRMAETRGGQRRLLRSSSSACSASPWTRPGATGSPGSTTSSRPTSPRSPYPMTPLTGCRRGAGLGLALVLRSRDRQPDRRLPLSRRHRPPSGCCRSTAARSAARRHQGGDALPRDLDGLRRGLENQ